jgi:hypothetical protein
VSKNLAVIAAVGITLYNAAKFIPKLKKSNNIGSVMVKKLASFRKKGMQDFSFSEELTYDYGMIVPIPISDQWIEKCELVGLYDGRQVCERYDDYIVSFDDGIIRNIPTLCLVNDFDCLNTMNNIKKCYDYGGHLDYGGRQHECHIGAPEESSVLGVNSCLINDKYACPYMFLKGGGEINFDE